LALVGVGLVGGVLLATGGQNLGTLAQTNGDCQTFPQTGHNVCGQFLAYWKGHGGLAQQGYPISEEFIETSDLNGKPYTVQYFERAVFELHPENQPPYDVLLSQLGTFAGHANYVHGFNVPAGTPPFYENRLEPIPTLKSYYNAINRKEYDRAYSYFEGSPNPPATLVGPFAQFAAGYANTVRVDLAAGQPTTDAGAGNLYSTIPVVLTAFQKDGSRQVFAGCYGLHRHNVGISGDPNDLYWKISKATVATASAGVSVDTLLAQQKCR
jgi:hypothetical protein